MVLSSQCHDIKINPNVSGLKALLNLLFSYLLKDHVQCNYQNVTYM